MSGNINDYGFNSRQNFVANPPNRLRTDSIKPDNLHGFSDDVETPEKVLEQILAKKIDGIEGDSIIRNSNGSRNGNGFSPEAVATRILSVVEKTIANRAGSDIEAQSLLQEAREGIAQGFSEAREILSSIANITEKMTSTINQQVDDTEALIFQGLDRLDISYSAAGRQTSGQSISESTSFSSQFKQSNQASIQIITQDGDKIDISYSAFIQAASSENIAYGGRGFSASFGSSAQSSIDFQFRVQGNINEEEQQAINALLDKVGNLAEQFFQGDVQAAFSAAQNIGFDSNELKSFALDFQQSTQAQVTQSYQRTDKINQPTGSLVNASSPSAAIAVLSQLEDLIALAEKNTSISNADNMLKSLLSDMLDLLNEDLELPEKNYIKDIIHDDS